MTTLKKNDPKTNPGSASYPIDEHPLPSPHGKSKKRAVPKRHSRSRSRDSEQDPGLFDESGASGHAFADDEVLSLEAFIDMTAEKTSDTENEAFGQSSTMKKTDKKEAASSKPTMRKARRRQIDPTTCERDYSNDEIEFMNALDEYKRSSGRMFPTCSEILEVLRNLGYEKNESAPENV